MGKDYSVIAVDKFIRATRDSGYKGTANAVAELVDNALQANAMSVEIRFLRTDNGSIEIAVQDDGTGMRPVELREALRFGGSSRFNDRDGLGRYGMGLPNSSLSQARRLTVYSWTRPNTVYTSYLDLDEIASGLMEQVPAPKRVRFPFGDTGSTSGTLVVWSKCDRIDGNRGKALRNSLVKALSRIFRYFIWDGLSLSVDTVLVSATDPLFLDKRAKHTGAKAFGHPIEYQVQVPGSDPPTIGRVTVKFSELPIHKWHGLSSKEKRERGVSMGSGVSIVRAGREVDRGWFFMGGKRRENYDDWWRCEIHFDPVLDELFGLTHTKQQIRPVEYLAEIVVPDVEATARALNARARRAYLDVKSAENRREAEEIASRADRLLSPLPRKATADSMRLLSATRNENVSIRKFLDDGETRYGVFNLSIPGTLMFGYGLHRSRLLLMINSDHPFAKLIHEPLLRGETEENRFLGTRLELMLLAAARAEATLSRDGNELVFEQFRRLWSDVLAAYLLSEK